MPIEGTTLVRFSDLVAAQRRFEATLRRAHKLRIMREGLPATLSITGPITLHSFSYSSYLQRLEKLVSVVTASDVLADVSVLKRALRLMEEGHRGQLRKNGELYIEHPISVAEELARLGLGPEEVAAGAGHDLIEDGRINGERVTKEFLVAELSPRVGKIIDGVTELGKEPGFAEDVSVVKIYRKLLEEGLQDLAVLVVKLADRLHNMRTLEHMEEEKQKQKARETLRIYAPLASILGLWPMKTELEDLAFKYQDPPAYQACLEKRDQVLVESRGRVEETKVSLEQALSRMGIEARVSLEMRGLYELYSRVKNKIDHISPSDVWRVSIVVPTQASEQNCYQVLGVVHHLFRSVQGRFRDYISEKRPNGHEFLHTWIRVPRFGQLLVQVRNERMQDKNERGVLTERDWHKKGHVLLEAMVDYLRREEELSEAEVGEVITAASFPITVYTPREKSLQLPFGSTVLDFARAIHEAIFLHAVGAEVNGQPVGLDHRLHEGDTVFIQTDPSSHPTIAWVDHVHTSAASASLRSYLRSRSRAAIVRDALAALDQESQRVYLPAEDLINTALFSKVIGSFNLHSPYDLLHEIGTGRIKARKVFAQAQKVYFRELMAAKRELERLKTQIDALRQKQKTPQEAERLQQLEKRYASRITPYWISIKLPLKPEEAQQKIGVIAGYVKPLEEIRFSIADSFPVFDGEQVLLVLAVNVIGGRKGGRKPGQIQRLIVRTIAARLGEVSVITNRATIEHYLEVKKRTIHFV